MKMFSLLLLLSFFYSANATTYYFSNSSGDDSRSPDEAKNPSTPWKTLKKLNTFFSSLNPGDEVLLKRGDVFFGSVIVNKSGTPGTPITIGDYGSGEKPVITSLISLDNWVFKGRGIWESSGAFGSAVNAVLINNVDQELGRYPNSDDINKGYLNFESHIGTASISDDELTSKTDWTGAQLVIRPRRWVIDRDLITDHSGNKISYAATSQYAPYDKQGYFIENDVRTLDKFGEWYYSPSAQKLSVFLGKNVPSAYTIEVPTVDNAVYCYRFSNIIFNNLNIKGSNICGFNIRGGFNISITNCDINFSGQNGVKVTSHTNFSITGSAVSNSHNNGIDLGYSGDHAVVRNNKIINTALFAGMVGGGDGKGMAIHSNGNGNIIEYNEIRNTGYTAINFNGNKVTIKNNLIDSFCLIKDDGGGIYCSLSPSSASERKITGNIILNGIGAGEGTSNPLYWPAEGIYFDNNASNIEMRDNTIANCNNNGIYIHNSYGMTLNNNTIYNNVKQLNVVEDPDNSRVRNCFFTNNVFFSKVPSQIVSNIRVSADDINLLGNFNNNYYARPLDDRLDIFSSYVNSNGNRINQNFDLQGWKNKYGQDKDSKITAAQIEMYKLNKLTSRNKVDNGTFTDSIGGVVEKLCTPSWGSAGKLDGGYLQVDPQARGSSVYVNIGSVKAGKNYLLKYSVRGSADSSTTISAYMRQVGGDYIWLTALQTRKLSVARSNFEMLLSPSADEDSASVVFKVDDANEYYLDNIQVFEANAIVTNPDDSLRFDYNATAAKKTISLDGNYIDVRGKKYNNSITLLPYTSAILLKNNQPDTSGTNEPPVVSITSPSDGKKFFGNAAINISADASDEDGSVAKVEFYRDDVLLATDNSAPYVYLWKNVANGTYTITAKATDNDGLAASDAVHITVGSTSEAPVVKLTSPGNNTNYTNSATIKINADASDSNGTIAKVEFYSDSTLLHTETGAPYTYTWLNVPNGHYSITAKATDNDGIETISDAVNVTVGPVKGAPSVSITDPVSGDKFTGPASVHLLASASDKDGSISKVEFYSGSVLLHTEYEMPYSYVWDSVAADNYQIMAVATDNDGNVTTSDIVPVTVISDSGAITANRQASKNSNDTTLSSGNNNKTIGLKLSPNPARNILNVVTSGLSQNQKITISVLSASGTIMKVFQSSAGQNQVAQIDVSSLSTGVYFVKVVSGDKVLNQRFVKL